MALPELSAFRLVGGTSLALQIGHRTSIDIDLFFLLQEFTLVDLIKIFRRKYPYVDYKFVVESLGAIDMADATEEPKIFTPINWHDAKKTIAGTIKLYVDGLKTNIAAQLAERVRKAQELIN